MKLVGDQKLKYISVCIVLNWIRLTNLITIFMSLTLYYHPISQPARAVLALLGLGKIQYEGKIVEIFKGGARTPEYLELNPFGGVPFIIHDKVHLSESNAILTHLCESYSTELKGFYGENSVDRDHINQYLSWYQSTYRPSLMRGLRLKFSGLRSGKPVSKEGLAEAEKQLKETISFLQKRLSNGTSYLVGNHITIADLLIFFESTDLEVYKIDIAQWPHFSAWYNSLIANPVIGAIHTQFREGLQNFQGMFANLQYTD